MGSLRFPRLFLITILSVFLGINGVYSQCLESQRSKLLQLKQSLIFNSSASSKLVFWNSSTDCCSWAGISCSDGFVTAIDLSNESIFGGLNSSSTLFDLQYLQSLNLAYNTLSTTIPSGFGKLVNLIKLNLSNSGFIGQIPVEISYMTRLVTLDFSNLYYGDYPLLKLENPNLVKLVQNLTELRELHLDAVNISAHGKEWCQAISSSLPNLQVLSLSNCHLSGPIDSSILKLQWLSVIRLDNNNLSSPVPGFFANFRNLTSLHLSYCGLYGTFPNKIIQVTTLQTLDLPYNDLLHGYLPEFPQNASLQTLVLSYTKFSGELPDSIGNLNRLSTIDLESCNFSGAIPNSMTSLTRLVYVDFSSNSFTGPIPSFSSSKNLTQLDLSHNRFNGSILSIDWGDLSNLVNLDLHNNSLSGNIPLSVFHIPSLMQLQLSRNQFTGQVSELSNVSSLVLNALDLSRNKLQGHFPTSVFELRGLKELTLSSNNFGGTLELNVIQQLRNLSSLDLSHNSLSINTNGTNSTSSSFPQIGTLKLASCNLRKFPDFLKSQSRLIYLDLSNNQLHGEIPHWIWKPDVRLHLNLSCNFLVGLEGPLPNSGSLLSTLDLHSNQLQGQIPILPSLYALYLDYSRNNFSSIIPEAIGSYVSSTIFFSLSSNNFHGSIPDSICNATYLQVLDLSNNSLSGKIPHCLATLSGSLGVLNLRGNNLTGNISDTFQGNCSLKTLDLNGNSLEGLLPKSLANCKELEVLDLGKNQINDIFPCWLKNISSLRVLVLRSNKFHGSIGCPERNSTWEMLQIVDLASNHFSGQLQSQSFRTWKAMMPHEDEAQSKLNSLRFEFLGLSEMYYQDTVTVTGKGLEMELVKILTIYTSIDFSCNNFEGEIPEVVGDFKSLYILNLSHNAFTGQIPSALGNLQQLESLDLSCNNLSGRIPMQLANLTFLSVLNLSTNQLEGMIPSGNQFQTFSEASFQGNKGLCGAPLYVKCTNIGGAIDRHSDSGTQIEWEYISAEIGFIFGLGVVIGPLVFWKRWRKWYYKHVDRIVLKICCTQERKRGNHGTRARRN